MRSPLQPVAEAVFALLQSDQTLVAAASGGIYDVVPENPTYPFVWYEVNRPIDARGFGLGPLPQIEWRTHVYSQAGQMVEAQSINDRIVRVLADQPLPIDPTIYTIAGWIISESEVTLPVEELRGVPVHEIVAQFRCYVEEVVAP